MSGFGKGGFGRSAPNGNEAKAKGDAWEASLTKQLRKAGLPVARNKDAGRNDMGDMAIPLESNAGICVQAKAAERTPTLKQVGATLKGQCREQAQRMGENLRLAEAWPVIIHKGWPASEGGLARNDDAIVCMGLGDFAKLATLARDRAKQERRADELARQLAWVQSPIVKAVVDKLLASERHKAEAGSEHPGQGLETKPGDSSLTRGS